MTLCDHGYHDDGEHCPVCNPVTDLEAAAKAFVERWHEGAISKRAADEMEAELLSLLRRATRRHGEDL